MGMMALLDVEAAAISWNADGGVVFDDPGCPWIVRVWTRRRRGRPVATGLDVTARNGKAISANQLARLPLAQIVGLVEKGSMVARSHPNETYYRALVDQMEPGQREWGDDHYRRVLTVFQWARDSSRTGGGIRAVAELWGVTRLPTAQRWLTEARKRKLEPF